jgi:hypothetical protein
MAAQPLTAVVLVALASYASAQGQSGSGSSSWNDGVMVDEPIKGLPSTDATKVAAASVTVQLSLPIAKAVAQKIVSDDTVLNAFKTGFKQDIAAALAGVKSTDIAIAPQPYGVKVGSLIVNFTVTKPASAPLPDVKSELAKPIMYTKVSSDPTVTSAVGTTFANQLTGTPTVTYASTACGAGDQAICGNDATCTATQVGYQCDCKTKSGLKYFTANTGANMMYACTKPAAKLSKEPNGATQAGLVSAAAMVAAVCLLL